jgi:hypothetical protein
MDEKTIEDWCDILGLTNYDILKDGSVDVHNDRLTSLFTIRDVISNIIPIRFHIIKGDFSCSYIGLTNLERSPIKVYGNFYCHDNQLTNLKGGPIEVDGFYNCGKNKIISLDGGPKKVGGDFLCLHNPIFREYSKYDNYTQYLRTIKLKQLLWEKDQ